MPYLGEFLFQAQDYSGIVKFHRKTMKNKQNFSDIDAQYYKYSFSKKRELFYTFSLKIECQVGNLKEAKCDGTRICRTKFCLICFLEIIVLTYVLLLVLLNTQRSLDGLTAPLQFFRAIPSLFSEYEFNTGLIKPKTLILWGGTNSSLVIDGAYHSKAYCENAELKVLPGNSNLHIDEPQIINQIIEEFLNKS